MTLEGGQKTILDLNQQLEKFFSRKATKQEEERIEKLKDVREDTINKARKIGVKKSKITKELTKIDKRLQEDVGRKEAQKLITQSSVLNSQYEELQKDRAIQLERRKFSENEANKLLGKDFEFVVDYEFKPKLKIQASDLIKSKNPALTILKKWENRVHKAIKEEDEKPPAEQSIKRYAVFDRMLTNIRKNKNLVREDIEDYEEEDEDTIYEIGGTHPILIDIVAEEIALHSLGLSPNGGEEIIEFERRIAEEEADFDEWEAGEIEEFDF